MFPTVLPILLVLPPITVPPVLPATFPVEGHVVPAAMLSLTVMPVTAAPVLDVLEGMI